MAKRSLSNALPGTAYELRDNKIRRKLCLDKCFLKKSEQTWHELDDIWPIILNFVEKLRLNDWWKKGQIQYFKSTLKQCCDPYEPGLVFMQTFNYNRRDCSQVWMDQGFYDSTQVFTYWHRFIADVVEAKVLMYLHCGTEQTCTYWSVREQAVHTWTTQHFLV